jgi:hypothetical protein
MSDEVEMKEFELHYAVTIYGEGTVYVERPEGTDPEDIVLTRDEMDDLYRDENILTMASWEHQRI